MVAMKVGDAMKVFDKDSPYGGLKGFTNSEVSLCVSKTGCSPSLAVQALKDAGGSVMYAVMDINQRKREKLDEGLQFGEVSRGGVTNVKGRE
ncbi:hypothetical protein TrRE_jg2995 [Triparma retinervis]|uniref:Uncharacterized protein n=1 Tax=Triparma retinervis TaxID=2557542 RepID=A0A9W7DSB9_9STRA|nr:hypothetical protein TrRE_jg2995 [Triparma retinervis]